MSRSLPTDLCSDAALIARIQRGDDRGYAELLKVHLTSVRAIALNPVRRELQRFAREQKNQSRFQHAGIDQLITSSEKQQAAGKVGFPEECLAQLPESRVSLVDAHNRKGRPNDEIAVEWRRSLEWVRVTLLRVSRKLCECIEANMEVAYHH